MNRETLVMGIVFIGLGFLFVFNNKNIAKGASKLYAKIYTEKNLRVMFRVVGIILVLAGIFFLFFK